MKRRCTRCRKFLDTSEFYTKGNGRRYIRCRNCTEHARSYKSFIPRNLVEMAKKYPHILAIDLLVAGIDVEDIKIISKTMQSLYKELLNHV